MMNHEPMARNDVMVSISEDDPKNLAGGGGGYGGGGGDACSTKMHIITFNEFKSKICELGKKEESPSSTLKPQCAKVPQRLRSDVKGAKVYYEPHVMSFGPYHHGKPHLQVGETLKLKLAATYFQECELSEDEIYNTISHDIGVLRKHYNQRSTEEYTDEELSVMLLVDGCALLRYILCVCLGDHEEYGIRYQDLSRIQQDTLLLENQLPYQLLQNLIQNIMSNDVWTVFFQEFFYLSTDGFFFQKFFGLKEESFLQKMKKYCCCRLFLPITNRNSIPKLEKESKPCSHLLDLYRLNLLGDERSYPTLLQSATVKERGLQGSVGDLKKRVMASFRNVKEMMATGIRIKPSPTHCLRDISFTSNGITPCLRLPAITIDNSTKTLCLNLIAYEMSSDVPHDFISYFLFLDSLIGHVDDVKELQSAGVLQNNLGTHEQVVQFFKTVSSFNLEPNFNAYKDVRVQIRNHLKSNYNSILKLWMRQCLDTYFSSPWTIIAWVGVTLALFFTAVQTYFAVFHP